MKQAPVSRIDGSCMNTEVLTFDLLFENTMLEPHILVFLIYLSILTVSKLFLVCMTVYQGEIHFVNTV